MRASPGPRTVTARRLQVLGTLLDRGLDVISTDLDAFWLPDRTLGVQGRRWFEARDHAGRAGDGSIRDLDPGASGDEARYQQALARLHRQRERGRPAVPPDRQGRTVGRGHS